MKKITTAILATSMLFSSVSCFAKETPSAYPFSINGTEFTMGMTYDEVMAALQECSMARVEDYHFPALRIGDTPLYLEEAGKWIEGSSMNYGPVEFRFVVAMPDDMDSDDSDGAVALLKESGRLCEVNYDANDTEMEDYNISEFKIDAWVITSETTGADMMAFAKDRDMLFEENGERAYCGIIDEIDDEEYAAFTITSFFTDESKTSLNQLDYSIEPEYYMAVLYEAE